jgi:hypothetical protein
VWQDDVIPDLVMREGVTYINTSASMLQNDPSGLELSSVK